MRGQAGFFDIDERLKDLSAKGDDLERLKGLVDFEMFRAALRQAVPRSERGKGGRPPFDHVLMFKVLVLQSMHSPVGRALRVPDQGQALFHALPRARARRCGAGRQHDLDLPRGADAGIEIDGEAAVGMLFKRFDAAVKASGYLAMGGQIVDATIVSAPKQRNTLAEKAAIKDGRIPEDWKANPAKLAQKDRAARWTVKYTKAKPREDGVKMVDIAIPSFGYKNHIGIDRRHGLIRTWTVTDAAAHDGARLATLLDRENTASDVWADTAYRSKKNEAHLAKRGFVSRIHVKKPKGRPMPDATRIANARKSRVRSAVEHVFAHEKGLLGLVVRTIGIARAGTKIGLVNLAYNMRRFIWLEGRGAPVGA